jgi:hypothetical protein
MSRSSTGRRFTAEAPLLRERNEDGLSTGEALLKHLSGHLFRDATFHRPGVDHDAKDD